MPSVKPLSFRERSQYAAQDALRSLKAMTNFETDSRNRVTFILAGQPELTKILSYAHFDSLRARMLGAVPQNRSVYTLVRTQISKFFIYS